MSSGNVDNITDLDKLTITFNSALTSDVTLTVVSPATCKGRIGSSGVNKTYNIDKTDTTALDGGTLVIPAPTAPGPVDPPVDPVVDASASLTFEDEFTTPTTLTNQQASLWVLDVTANEGSKAVTQFDLYLDGVASGNPTNLGAGFTNATIRYAAVINKTKADIKGSTLQVKFDDEDLQDVTVID